MKPFPIRSSAPASASVAPSMPKPKTTRRPSSSLFDARRAGIWCVPMKSARLGILLVSAGFAGLPTRRPAARRRRRPIADRDRLRRAQRRRPRNPPPAAPSASAAAAEPPFRAEDVTAVVVWQKDDKAKGGFRSSWVERVDQKPRSWPSAPGSSCFPRRPRGRSGRRR